MSLRVSIFLVLLAFQTETSETVMPKTGMCVLSSQVILGVLCGYLLTAYFFTSPHTLACFDSELQEPSNKQAEV